MYTAHRNLNARDSHSTWSFYDRSILPHRVTPASGLILQNVTVKQPSGKKFEATMRGEKRAVFTWFKSEYLETRTNSQPISLPENAVRVRFNPRNGDRFFHVDGKRIDAMKTVFLLSTGECFAIIPE